MDIVVTATQQMLVKQLSELLQARDLSCDELGLLYCYKNGVSVGQALKTVGFEGKLAEFVGMHKSFLLNTDGQVSLVRDDTALKPFSVSEELRRILELSESGSMEMTTLCAKFVQKFNVSITSVTGMKPADFFAKEVLFAVTGRGRVSLKSETITSQSHKPAVVQQAPRTPPSQAHVQRAAPTPSVRAKGQPEVTATAVVPAEAEETEETAETEEEVAENQQYLDLHTKISGRSFNSKVAQTLNDVVDLVSDITFLNIDHVVKGGSVGKATSIVDVTDAQVVFFLKGVPPALQEKWLPPLLKAVAGALGESLSTTDGVDGLRIVGDCLRMRAKGLVDIELRFSPAFASHDEAVQRMGQQGPEARRCLGAALAKESVQFIAKQPGQVKVTMRLLKWWREQQAWSGAMSRPSDELLELMAVYSAVQTRPTDQRTAVANVMSLLARFDELRIVWSNYYSKEDLWGPLLHQRPLLMDPVNPFVNVADPQMFDASELMELARSTHFFW